MLAYQLYLSLHICNPCLYFIQNNVDRRLGLSLLICNPCLFFIFATLLKNRFILAYNLDLSLLICNPCLYFIQNNVDRRLGLSLLICNPCLFFIFAILLKNRFILAYMQSLFIFHKS
jgi:hypothetical protein